MGVEKKTLRVEGARENNLKQITLSVPHDQLTVVTGLSGSGKSSLAFDTIYAEGQRRYIETFSPYTRQFFDKVKKPDVDAIHGVRPAVAIQQRTRITSSRSTVGSMTDINDYLKVLWANLATPVCSSCGIELRRYRPRELATLLTEWLHIRPHSTFLICGAISLSPAESRVSPPRKTGASKKAKKTSAPKRLGTDISPLQVCTELSALGFSRVFDPRSANTLQLDEISEMPVNEAQRALLVLDRVRAGSAKSPALTKRLTESIDQSYSLATHKLPSGARGLELCCIVEINDEPLTHRPFLTVLNGPKQENQKPAPFRLHEFAPVFRCERGSFQIAPSRPSLFSFNNPVGACPDCKGFGKALTVDRSLCVPNPNLSLKEKAIQCWAGPGARIELKELLKFCQVENIPVDVPWKLLSDLDKEKIFTTKNKDFWGILPWFKWVERKTYKMHVRVFLSKYRTQVPCLTCEGTRLKPEALAYKLKGKNIHEIWNLPIAQVVKFVRSLQEDSASLSNVPRALKDLFEALLARLSFLDDLGLSYLTLERQARTLSGGETQRVNLATALGSELVSTQFVLDEPSVGLHARDSARLIRAVRSLADRGNSVLVVEHDLEFIRSADHIIELGPRAGAEGGSVVFAGELQDWSGIKVSLPHMASPDAFRSQPRTNLSFKNATARNLKGLSGEIPLQSFVCLTGVSGSGKSSLVSEVIVKSYERHKLGIVEESNPGDCQGFEHLDQVLVIDQAPLAKSPRANIATYSGIWDSVRDLLAATDSAKSFALSKSSFSFNVDAGRCPECSGVGFIREDMQFLSDVYVPCELCLGKRFQQTVLDVQYSGKNVSEILGLSIEQCKSFFSSGSTIVSAASILCDLGLGHLTLGHPLSELSGGEAQRLKLVPVIEASRRAHLPSSKGTLLIFDEPTTGLHQHDVERLISVFSLLRSQGHSILCIEHNLSLIASADWLIDLGPEGGELGGQIVATGTPAEFLSDPILSRSYTAQYLKSFLNDWGIKGTSSDAPHHRHSTAKEKGGAINGGQKSLPPTRPEDRDHLRIRGATEHNLKNISIDIPLRRFVALTGVSGSGKSTLAKDIIYAEGQRRYLDCLSPYARQFIKELKKPDIEDIKNVMPTICVYQHTFQPSRLSTVGTMSEIYNFLRLLYAKTGVQHCPDHPDKRISPLSPEDIARTIRAMKEKSVRVLAPIIKMKKGNHRAVLERATSSELTQIRIDGVFLSPGTVQMSGGLEKNKPHSIDFVLGKFNPAQVEDGIMTEMVAQALSLGGGNLIVVKDKDEVIFSTERTCPECKRGFFKPDPEDLSFNSKRGRCPSCDGSGKHSGKGGTLTNLPCKECGGARLGPLGRNLRLDGRAIHEASALTPQELTAFIQTIPFGEGHARIAEPVLRELLEKAETLVTIGLDYLSLSRDCNSLSSGELQRLRLATAMGSPLSGAMYIFDEPSAGLHPLDNRRVLGCLERLLDRDNSILMIEHDSDSIRSAEYIIDVGPGGGREGGNIVFEGALPEFLKHADSITAQCLREESGLGEENSSIFNPDCPSSSAPRTETHALAVPQAIKPIITKKNSKKLPPQVLTPAVAPNLSIRNASMHNIKGLSLVLPLGKLVAIAGVSGAGKSSFLHGIVSSVLRSSVKSKTHWGTDYASLESNVEIERVLEVDQKPIGINSRSTPASYLKVFDDVRILFSSTNEAKARGWTPGFFSYNSGKGRCLACKGLGVIKLEMSFLPDARVECESCRGDRYADEALSVKYLGLSIADVLKLTFSEAKSVFANHRRIHHKLHLACELGLGYLTLGQSSASLSGGESQRLKLVAELATPRRGHTIYMLDEPTTGLHKADVQKLLHTLGDLVRLGNSVLVIEHDRDVILKADHVIEFGPGPGERGGTVVFQGDSKHLLNATTNWGEVLKESALKAFSAPIENIGMSAH